MCDDAPVVGTAAGARVSAAGSASLAPEYLPARWHLSPTMPAPFARPRALSEDRCCGATWLEDKNWATSCPEHRGPLGMRWAGASSIGANATGHKKSCDAADPGSQRDCASSSACRAPEPTLPQARPANAPRGIRPNALPDSRAALHSPRDRQSGHSGRSGASSSSDIAAGQVSDYARCRGSTAPPGQALSARAAKLGGRPVEGTGAHSHRRTQQMKGAAAAGGAGSHAVSATSALRLQSQLEEAQRQVQALEGQAEEMLTDMDDLRRDLRRKEGELQDMKKTVCGLREQASHGRVASDRQEVAGNPQEAMVCLSATASCSNSGSGPLGLLSPEASSILTIGSPGTASSSMPLSAFTHPVRSQSAPRPRSPRGAGFGGAVSRQYTPSPSRPRQQPQAMGHMLPGVSSFDHGCNGSRSPDMPRGGRALVPPLALSSMPGCENSFHASAVGGLAGSPMLPGRAGEWLQDASGNTSLPTIGGLVGTARARLPGPASVPGSLRVSGPPGSSGPSAPSSAQRAASPSMREPQGECLRPDDGPLNWSSSLPSPYALHSPRSGMDAWCGSPVRARPQSSSVSCAAGRSCGAALTAGSSPRSAASHLVPVASPRGANHGAAGASLVRPARGRFGSGDGSWPVTPATRGFGSGESSWPVTPRGLRDSHGALAQPALDHGGSSPPLSARLKGSYGGSAAPPSRAALSGALPLQRGGSPGAMAAAGPARGAPSGPLRGQSSGGCCPGGQSHNVPGPPVAARHPPHHPPPAVALAAPGALTPRASLVIARRL